MTCPQLVFIPYDVVSLESGRHCRAGLEFLPSLFVPTSLFWAPECEKSLAACHPRLWCRVRARRDSQRERRGGPVLHIFIRFRHLEDCVFSSEARRCESAVLQTTSRHTDRRERVLINRS